MYHVMAGFMQLPPNDTIPQTAPSACTTSSARNAAAVALTAARSGPNESDTFA
jgi:hypothetical protein